MPPAPKANRAVTPNSTSRDISSRPKKNHASIPSAISIMAKHRRGLSRNCQRPERGFFFRYSVGFRSSCISYPSNRLTVLLRCTTQTKVDAIAGRETRMMACAHPMPRIDRELNTTSPGQEANRPAFRLHGSRCLSPDRSHQVWPAWFMQSEGFDLQVALFNEIPDGDMIVSANAGGDINSIAATRILRIAGNLRVALAARKRLCCRRCRHG